MVISKNDRLELMNIVGDLQRSIMFLVRNQSQDCIFLKNIIKNYPNLIKLDPNISKFIDINYLNNNSDLPNIKAENLLLQSIRLQNYLGL